MKKVLIEKNILFGLLLAIFVVIFEVIFFKLSLPAWPAFMVMIFFFVVHEDTKQAPHILVGGLAGILAVVLLGLFTTPSNPCWDTRWQNLCSSVCLCTQLSS